MLHFSQFQQKLLYRHTEIDREADREMRKESVAINGTTNPHPQVDSISTQRPINKNEIILNIFSSSLSFGVYFGN